MPFNGSDPSRSIVEEKELLPRDIVREEVWNLCKLYKEIPDKEACLEWLARHRLIRNSLICPTGCGNACLFRIKPDVPDGRQWGCRYCSSKKTVRDGSFFPSSSISLKQMLILMYCWCCDLPPKIISRESDVPLTRVVHWCKNFQKEIDKWLEKNSDTEFKNNLNGPNRFTQFMCVISDNYEL